MSMRNSKASHPDGTVEYDNTDMPRHEPRKALVLPGAFYSSVVALMAEGGYIKAKDLDDADVVVFTGGADVNPLLYGEKNVAACGIDKNRDDFEVNIYHEAVKRGLVMFGICRGAQFLHVMNNGKLWQDVNNHGTSHEILDLDDDVTVMATSIHHQMLQINEDIEVVAIANKQVATRFRDATTTITLGDTKGVSDDIEELEIEAGAYAKTKSFFVQGHPEIGSAEYRAWTMHKLNDFYLDWTGQTVQIADVIERMN